MSRNRRGQQKKYKAYYCPEGYADIGAHHGNREQHKAAADGAGSPCGAHSDTGARRARHVNRRADRDAGGDGHADLAPGDDESGGAAPERTDEPVFPRDGT